MLPIIIIVLVVFIYFQTYQDFQRYIFGTGSPVIGIVSGAHGNELSGPTALYHMIDNGYFNNWNGTIKIIPALNTPGISINNRYRYGLDMNRIYGNFILHPIALQVLDFFDDCDVVIDIHDGWGWNKINPKSLGSTITPSDVSTSLIAYRAAHIVNSTIENQDKHFMVNDYKTVPCSIYTTLSCWNQRHYRKHYLIEITGQKNIQPIEVRVYQIYIILESIIQNYIKRNVS